MSNRLFGPASEQAVRAVEARLGHRLPADYRQLVLDSGFGLIGAHEVYGPMPDLEGPPGLESLLDDLEEEGHSLPFGVVPISELGNGDFVCVVASSHAHPEGSVVAWGPEPDSEGRLYPLYSSLKEWLRS